MNAPAFIKNEKQNRIFVLIVSLAIPVVVTLLRYMPVPEVSDEALGKLYALPLLNAVLNGSTFVLLIAAFIAIKKKKIETHRKLMTTAMVFSALFLVSYVVFHATTQHTPYGEEGSMQSIYYFVLVSHIILSAVIVPLVLLAFTHGLAERYQQHKKIVKLAFPLWLYVTLTGVIVYLMISPFYTHSPF